MVEALTLCGSERLSGPVFDSALAAKMECVGRNRIRKIEKAQPVGSTRVRREASRVKVETK